MTQKSRLLKLFETGQNLQSAWLALRFVINGTKINTKQRFIVKWTRQYVDAFILSNNMIVSGARSSQTTWLRRPNQPHIRSHLRHVPSVLERMHAENVRIEATRRWEWTEDWNHGGQSQRRHHPICHSEVRFYPRVIFIEAIFWKSTRMRLLVPVSPLNQEALNFLEEEPNDKNYDFQ